MWKEESLATKRQHQQGNSPGTQAKGIIDSAKDEGTHTFEAGGTRAIVHHEIWTVD